MTWLALAALALVAPAWADDTAARFHRIYEQEWAWRNGQAGINNAGEAQPSNARLDDVDAASQQRRLDKWKQTLAELDGVDPKQLGAEDRVNYAVYRTQIQNMLAGQQYKQWQMPFNSDSAFWSDLGYVLNADELRTPQDYRRYLDRLGQVPAYFDQQIANMRDGLDRGFTVPRAVLDGRDASIVAVAQLKDATQSSFYKPFEHISTAVSAEDAARMREEAKQTIAQKVIPAYATLLKFFREEYVPRARTTLAAEAMPDGKAWYRQQILEYTTLDLDPEAIHQIGLKEVARIDAEMQQTMKATGFQGDFPAFQKFLRTDPQFYAKTPEELLMRASWIAKRVDGKLAQYFGLLPRGRFGIEPVPDAIAPFWTAGRGGAHTYWVNTYDLPSRSLFNLTALTLHESAPGHSFQGSLVQEQKSVPDFRHEYISAYGEGWALYCEKLGKEMGIYQTPYDDFGRFSYEMWRAARLVIDTGVHHKGWTRAQAIQYLADHTALSQHEVETEVDRYISWPAQALSYKLGEIKILELRARAEKELGDKFDIRKFHDAVLDIGSVPLPLLETHIEEFIAQQKSAAAGTKAPSAL